MLSTTKRLPRGVRKHIRKEKNRIRKNVPENENYKEKIKTLYEKWRELKIKK